MREAAEPPRTTASQKLKTEILKTESEKRVFARHEFHKLKRRGKAERQKDEGRMQKGGLTAKTPRTPRFCHRDTENTEREGRRQNEECRNFHIRANP
jgi:hypothetical protein